MSKKSSWNAQNLTKPGEIVSFGVSIEDFIEEPALLYRFDVNDKMICDDKHVIFYISSDQPRHFFRYFSSADYVLVMHIKLCTYLLHCDMFVLADQLDHFTDLSEVKAVLHFSPPACTLRRVYLSEDSFEHLFTVSTHRVTDKRNKRVELSYHDDSGIGRTFKVHVNQKRRRLSAQDLCLADKFKQFSPSFIAVCQGRGWLTIIDDAC